MRTRARPRKGRSARTQHGRDPDHLILGHLAHFPHRGFQARLRYESTIRSPGHHRHTQSVSQGRPLARHCCATTHLL